MCLPALLELGSGVLAPEVLDGVALGSSLEVETSAVDSFTRAGWVASDMIERAQGLRLRDLGIWDASPLAVLL